MFLGHFNLGLRAIEISLSSVLKTQEILTCRNFMFSSLVPWFLLFLSLSDMLKRKLTVFWERLRFSGGTWAQYYIIIGVITWFTYKQSHLPAVRDSEFILGENWLYWGILKLSVSAISPIKFQENYSFSYFQSRSSALAKSDYEPSPSLVLAYN